MMNSPRTILMKVVVCCALASGGVQSAFACGSYFTTMTADASNVYATGTTEGDYGGWYPIAVYTTLHSPVFGRVATMSDGYDYIRYDLARATASLPINGETGAYSSNSQHEQSYDNGQTWNPIGTTYKDLAVSQPSLEFPITTRSFITNQYVFGVGICQHGTYGETALMYKGDNRWWDPLATSFRTQTKVTARPDQGIVALPSDYRLVGQSRSYAFFFEEDATPGDCYKFHAAQFTSTNNMNASGSAIAYRVVRTNIYGGANNPLEFPSPEISWNYTIDIDNSNPAAPRYTRSGSHDCFPAHEVYIKNQRIHDYAPQQSDAGYIGACLLGFNQVQLPVYSDRIY